MAKVTIEGSLSPSAYLGRGERIETQRDQHVENLIAGGFVNVIGEDNEPEPAPLPEAVPAPKRNASRDDWAEWLAEHTDVVTEGKDREQLLADYDEWQSTHDAPAADAE